ncbi:permease [Clostridium sp. 19966]|uniref:permease n=1 Tax=Clostridium sp. 19966 TaxID=2768166 RepID=UPI0028E06845|nr:permease [Clostridium sp. 19966]MDT8717290.1 permease [Clostridium sp. 19966]
MSNINNMGTIFLSIILEGFPFLIIGAIVSSIIQIFVSDETIAKISAKNKIAATFIISIIGIVFPVCECGIVPIVRKLVQKGMSVGTAVTFMLAVPIVNPVVFMSTYYAFIGHEEIAYLRMILGVVCSILIGTIIDSIATKYPLKEKHIVCDHEHEHHHHEHIHHHKEGRPKLNELMLDISEEFYEIGRYFIIGALISSALQTFVPRQIVVSIGHGNVSSIIMMMSLAFLLSICSETDAFIARTFLNQFTNGSIMAFLIFGPMLDLKNTIMLFGSFKASFVFKLIFVIICICFIMASLVTTLMPNV